MSNKGDPGLRSKHHACVPPIPCGVRRDGDNGPMSEPLHLLVETRMPYGKYKGTPIADLPGNYLNWFAREGFPPGQLGRLLALMHEIDHNGLKDLLAPLRPRG